MTPLPLSQQQATTSTGYMSSSSMSSNARAFFLKRRTLLVSFLISQSTFFFKKNWNEKIYYNISIIFYTHAYIYKCSLLLSYYSPLYQIQLSSFLLYFINRTGHAAIQITSLLHKNHNSVLFVGINSSANEKDETKIGHYFAASRNCFLSYLNESGNEPNKK